ncbi:CsbD family protein [Candidatus Saccharibacteria bacterium]|nr:CsbD family protein [Candidatus Saccharibacteria bacterium]MBJ58221.1 CsbD family protein [Candidatus Saccharibacteria bacterium]MBQ69823.1 CsbD family protein [Candidatus Saccharibacteria bacterium]|tara:strand:+ start:388 stop:579 length:192 start_codon:yes stop_codon:yes gene_type:complete
MNGFTDSLSGKAKQAAGKATDDKKLETEGKIEEIKGDAKNKVDEFTETTKDKIDEAKEKLDQK